MRTPEIPLPLLLLVAGTAVAAVVFVVMFDPFKTGAASGTTPESVPVRLRVLGFDREPRQGVTLILHRNAASHPLVLPSSGPNGHVDGRVPRGAYDVRVYAKKLSTPASRTQFRAARGLTRRGMEALQLLVTTLAVPATPSAGRTDVRLPTAAGY
jgi:hypothetical protein